MNSPIVTLPPDFIQDGPEFLQLNAVPDVWHLPKELWNNIWKKGFDGTNEVIAILDTGVSSHNLLPTPIAQRSFISGQQPNDPTSGHGTHCAGTALGRDGIGVAPKASLINGKVLSNSGSGSSAGIADGIKWAVDQGATIISMSLGSNSPYAPTQRAMQDADDAGVVVVAAAGNAGQRLPNNTIGYPGRYDECLCVGSMDSRGNISSFSSAGRELDVVTPGSQIVSTSNSNANGYKTMSGTSMATPFMAGLVAVVNSGRAAAGMPRFTSIAQWLQWLEQFCIDKGPSGHDPTWGHGVPDYNKIIEYLAQPEIKWV